MLNDADAAGAAAGHRVAGPQAPGMCPTGFTGLVLVGRGSQGQVFRATKSSIGKVVALEAFPLGTSSRTHDRALHAEVQALVALSQHPGVVDVHDLHISGGWAWLEMDYCGRGSAGAWAAGLRPRDSDDHPAAVDDRPAAVSALLRLGGQVAGALHFAHEQGWVHGDVKPSNILLDDRGTARLCDFGLARLSAAGAGAGRAAVTGSRAPGTPRFQPPEVVGGAAPTAAGDVYALAETLRDLRDALFAESASVLAGSWDPDITDTGELGTSCADVLADLEVLLTHMSDPDPGLRPRSDEIAERLAALDERLAQGIEGSSTQASTPQHPPDARPARLRLAGARFPRPSRSPPAALSPAAGRRPRGARVTVAAAVTVAFVLLLVGILSQMRGGSGTGRAADPTVAPARTPTPSPDAEPPGGAPEASPNSTLNASQQTGQPAAPIQPAGPSPPALGPPALGPVVPGPAAPGPAVGGGERVEPGPRGGTETVPVPSPSAQTPTPTVTYQFPPGTLSPQFRDGTCVYSIWYGNFGVTPFAKVRFYEGACGEEAAITVTVVAQRDGVTSSYRYTGGSTNTDSCGQYIEAQADGRGVAATAVGETLYFPETGHRYAFMSGTGQPPTPYRSLPCGGS